MPVFMALLPILVIFLLLVVWKTAADIAGLIGWIATIIIAWLYFTTPLQVIFTSSLSGIIASLPITLMVCTSIFQITVMQEAGAIKRVVTLIKQVSPNNPAVQVMIINIGFGTILAALGATPVSILPPIMIAMGYSSFVAIALPAIGYDALCTYAILGIPVVVFSGFVGLPVNEVGIFFARFMPVISSLIALGMLWIIGKWKMVIKGLIPALLSGLTAGFIAIATNKLGLITITGIVAGTGVVLVMFIFLLITKQPLYDRSVLRDDDKKIESSMSIWTAISPWILLVLFSLVINAPFLPFFDLTFKQWAMPLEIIPGSPEKMRVMWQAYLWVLISTFLSMPFLRITRNQLKASSQKWLKRFPRPAAASAIFFAIAYVINHSGKSLDWQLLDPQNNMVYVLANASVSLFGNLYPLISPFLGLLAGFISGSESSAIAMLTNLHLATADKIGAVGLLIAAASGIGGGLASVISPAKLQNAAASIDRIGEEVKIIPITFVISIVITSICGIMALIWAY